MSDRPILFSAPMVRALLEGRKTQTRRILPVERIKPSKWTHESIERIGLVPTMGWRAKAVGFNVWSSPFNLRFAKGDRLWVRETHYVWSAGYKDGTGRRINYRATEPDCPTSWTVSIHMPRWASRLTLAVSDVRVQRLQDISKGDVIAEGCAERDGLPLADVYAGWHEPYAALWDKINGAGAWGANPWVVAVTFGVEKRNIDQ